MLRVLGHGLRWGVLGLLVLFEPVVRIVLVSLALAGTLTALFFGFAGPAFPVRLLMIAAGCGLAYFAYCAVLGALAHTGSGGS
jgi:hypothetical protein